MYFIVDVGCIYVIDMLNTYFIAQIAENTIL